MKKSLGSYLTLKYENTPLRDQTFKDFLHDIARFLPSSVFPQSVEESVEDLLGTRATGDVLRQTAWRLAGNLESLRNGVAVRVWQYQAYPEWVPAQIVRVRFIRGGRRGTELGHEFSFRILAGSPAGVLTTQWWSRRKTAFLARYRNERMQGFAFLRMSYGETDDSPAFLYRDPRQLAQLRCLLFLERQLSDTQPGFRELGFSSSLHDWNRSIHERRARRLPETLCPFQLPKEYACHVCPFGWDQCRAAVHALTFEYRQCAECGDAEAAFNPEDGSKYCITCCEQRVLKGIL